MAFLLCRNRVADFPRWKAVFDSHATAHREAGLELTSLWRGIDDSNNVFFLFNVSDLSKARAFLGAAPSAEAAEESGVVDAEFHFLESGETY